MNTIFSNIHEIISNVISSKDELDIENYELEIRFGENTGRKFNPNIGKPLFDTIYELVTKRRFYDMLENAFIHDKIYDDGIKRIIKKVPKLMFDKKFYIHDNDKDVTIINMKKDKISQFTSDFLRVSFNKEEILENIDSNLKFQRMKYRVSISFEDIFRFDFTIVNNKDYIVEIEVLLSKIKDINHFETQYEKLKEKLKPITDTFENNLINNIIPTQPHTMISSDLFIVTSNKYTVTDKADGVRTFLKIHDNKATLINPKTKHVIREFGNIQLGNTLIDGEYVNNRFYAFDLIFYNGTDYRNDNLLKRLSVLRSNIQNITVGLYIKMKTFYNSDIFNNAKNILKGDHPYKIDGLIFTPINQPYDCKELPILKWKMRQTIDVRVKYNSKENFTYFIFGKKYGYINEWSQEYFERDYIRTHDSRTKRMHKLFHEFQEYEELKTKKIHFGKYKNYSNLFNTQFLGKPGKPNEDHLTGRTLNRNIDVILDKFDIMEYEYRGGEWYPLRKRTFDKEEANAIKTIEGVLKVVEENVSLDKMIEFENKYKINNTETIGTQYNEIAQDKTFKRHNWRKFHNYVKRRLIANGSNSCIGGSYLDLACGKGGDILKYIKLGYKNILAIDSSEVELYGKNGYVHRLCNNGFVDKGLYFEKQNLKITVVCGDISKNIRYGECVKNEEDKEKINDFFRRVNKFDVISIMFAIHYMFNDDSKRDTFFENISDLLKPEGKLIGTYLNMETDEDYIFKNHGIPFYKIENKGDSVEISNSVWGWGNSVKEPKISQEIIRKYFDDNDLIEVYNKSFSDVYENFKMNESILLQKDEQRLGFMNNYFMVVKSPEKIKKSIVL